MREVNFLPFTRPAPSSSHLLLPLSIPTLSLLYLSFDSLWKASLSSETPRTCTHAQIRIAPTLLRPLRPPSPPPPPAQSWHRDQDATRCTWLARQSFSACLPFPGTRPLTAGGPLFRPLHSPPDMPCLQLAGARIRIVKAAGLAAAHDPRSLPRQAAGMQAGREMRSVICSTACGSGPKARRKE